jgi:membrane-associated protease RseP (regulator of RpoE activity)
MERKRDDERTDGWMGIRSAFGPFQTGVLSLCAIAAISCSSAEPVRLAPHVELSPEDVDLKPAAPRQGVSIGLEVEGNEGDSLERLERLPGARVRAVEPTGPAAAAGLRPGDIILSVDGIATDDPDALAAAIERAADGKEVRLQARRGTVAFEAVAVARASPEGIPPHELYRVDPVRIRAGFRTEVVDAGGSPRTAAAVSKVFPGSPLTAAGIREGDLVLALDGVPLASGHDLVRRIVEDHKPGDAVRLEVLRDREVLARKVRLWEPERRLTKLAALPLFRYAHDARASRTEFSLLDFWIFSLFSVKKEVGEKEYRFLSLLRFGSGRGELIEEGRGAPGEVAP